MTSEELKEKYKKYSEWCKENKLPNFVAEDGCCYFCKRPVFRDNDKMEFITGCPHCHRSFCD